MHPSSYTEHRRSVLADRDAIDISRVEFANAIRFVLAEGPVAMREDLVYGVREEFGVRRLGRVVRERIESVISELIVHGVVSVTENAVTLADAEPAKTGTEVDALTT